MKREILFRGKRVDNGEWVYGSYIRCSNAPLKELHAIGEYYDKKWEVNPESVGQYTGLKDKEGNKIFEGDVLESFSYKESFKSIVEYLENGFYSKGLGSWKSINILNSKDKKVIGNIFDNAELIKNQIYSL